MCKESRDKDVNCYDVYSTISYNPSQCNKTRKHTKESERERDNSPYCERYVYLIKNIRVFIIIRPN
jgi:hypothetical protein